MNKITDFTDRDLGYIYTEGFNQMEEKMITIRKLLNGLIKSSNDYNN